MGNMGSRLQHHTNFAPHIYHSSLWGGIDVVRRSEHALAALSLEGISRPKAARLKESWGKASSPMSCMCTACVHIHPHTHGCSYDMHSRTHACKICTAALAHTRARARTHAHSPTYACTQHPHTHTHARAHTHAHDHSHIHAQAHAHTHMRRLGANARTLTITPTENQAPPGSQALGNKQMTMPQWRVRMQSHVFTSMCKHEHVHACIQTMARPAQTHNHDPKAERQRRRQRQRQ